MSGAKCALVCLCLGLLAASTTGEALAEKRGQVRSAPCPFSCRTEGIPKSVCRDWREGDSCFVEDLRRPPAPAVPTIRPVYPPVEADPGYGVKSGPRDRGDDRDRHACAGLDRYALAPPRIDIGRARPSGGFLQEGYRVGGSVEGRCLVEAGLFEEGRLVQSIPVVTIPEFRRFEFEVKARGDRRAEIRVYNSNGDRDIVQLDDVLYERDSGDRRRPADSPFDVFQGR